MCNGIKKKLILFILAAFMFASCSKPAETISEKMVSGSSVKVRSAFADIWRLGKIEHAAAVVGFLETDELKESAAYALAFLNSEIVDTIVMNKLNSAQRKDAYLFYFYLVSKNRKPGNKILEHIPENGLTKLEKMFRFMIVTEQGENKVKDGVDLYSKAAGIIWYENALRELLILAGENKEKKVLKFVESMTSDKKAGSAAKWAKNMILGKKLVQINISDRTIADNPFWKKSEDNPVIPVKPDSYKSVHTANPDILVHNDMLYYYYRGGDGNDRICLATVPMEYFDGINFSDYAKNPIVDIGKKGSFDDAAALDPATIYFNNKVFLYYSGLGTGEDAIGLAVSDNFYDFDKTKSNPVFAGRAPEVLVRDGIIYMYYVEVTVRNGYSIFLATSSDGYNFVRYSDEPVFTFDPDRNKWDGITVTTPRIIESNGVYYILYCGDNKYRDYPPYFGLAFSYDLVNWYRSSQNPIFSRGEKGAWDDGGIWYGQIMKYNNRLYLWYEGWGGGAESHEKEYGSGRSQIGLATSEYEIEDML